MKRRVVTDAALKAAGRRNTKASARLEGHELPPGYVRPAAVEQYLANVAIQRNTGGVLQVLRAEIWPLLTDSARDRRGGRSAPEGEAPMSRWDYRVVRSRDRTEYFIAEVYYDGDSMSWVDDSRNALRWDRYDDLKGTVELIQQAFDKPLLEVTADDLLVEVKAD